MNLHQWMRWKSDVLPRRVSLANRIIHDARQAGRDRILHRLPDGTEQ